LSFNFKFKPCLLRQRAELVGLKSIPTPHDFRRAFALIMLRNGVDIFALQKLLGHSDLQILRRYLAQTDEDVHTAHMRGSPVDGNCSPFRRSHYFPKVTFYEKDIYEKRPDQIPVLATCSSASLLRNSNRDFTRPHTHFHPQGIAERSL